MAASVEKGGRRRKGIKRFVLVVLACVLLVVAGIGWRVVSLLIAEPTVKVDYVAEYNRVTRPADYDPNDNAAPYYDKLFFSELRPLPDVLKSKCAEWPADLSPTELDALEQWAPLNESALETLHTAAGRPYRWARLESRDGRLPAIDELYLTRQGECFVALVLLAKYKAAQGDIDQAVSILADLHMMGIHRLEGSTLLEQLSGLGSCQFSYKAVLAVLDRCDVEAVTLDRARELFASRLSRIQVPRFTRGEFLVALDCIQRAFTDDGHGDGRLIPREFRRITSKSGFYSTTLSYPEAFWICLSHPSRKQTVDTYQRLFEAAEILAGKTPWQLKQQSTGYEQEVARILEGNYFLKGDVGAFATLLDIGSRGRTHGEATVTVLAVLTYKARKGSLPDSLEQLLAAGYLKEISIDPYSGKPLVYKVIGDDFTLYSVGGDFTDDGGVPSRWGMGSDGGDQVFWPVKDASNGT